MQLNVGKEIAALQRMAVADLKEKYAEVFGETTNTGNRTWLVRRIAWRLQALAEGDLSERARTRANSAARGTDLRYVGAPNLPGAPSIVPPTCDHPGGVEVRTFPTPGRVLNELDNLTSSGRVVWQTVTAVVRGGW